MIMECHQLTICIPTYNREAELDDALASIRDAFGGSVNVAVSDNASTQCLYRCH
jgi:glycosyltransferase involved in cell wall biosynthesis